MVVARGEFDGVVVVDYTVEVVVVGEESKMTRGKKRCIVVVTAL